jgi:hypothetical protein
MDKTYRDKKLSVSLCVFRAASPGVLTEILYLLLSEYNESMKVNEGGGLEAEQENIEVLEMKYEEAYNKIAVAK